VLTDVASRAQSVTVLGQRFDSPLILAPTGLPGVVWPNGAMEAALAADRAGVGFCLSTMSTSSIEEIAKASKRPVWFQLYVMRDRELGKSMMQRAKAAGCCALVITVDLQMQGQRDRDVRNGLTIPPQLRFSSAVDFALHPGWVWRLLTGPKITLANFASSGKGGDLFTIAEFVNAQFDPSVTWKDIDWVRNVWDGPLALKGILNPEARGSLSSMARTASSSRTTAAGSSTACPPPSPPCRAQWTPWRAAPSSSSTAACAAATTCSRRSRSAPRRA
jgi:L-lactate dehydrogenase (cytochrome)